MCVKPYVEPRVVTDCGVERGTDSGSLHMEHCGD